MGLGRVKQYMLSYQCASEYLCVFPRAIECERELIALRLEAG